MRFSDAVKAQAKKIITFLTLQIVCILKEKIRENNKSNG